MAKPSAFEKAYLAGSTPAPVAPPPSSGGAFEKAYLAGSGQPAPAPSGKHGSFGGNLLRGAVGAVSSIPAVVTTVAKAAGTDLTNLVEHPGRPQGVFAGSKNSALYRNVVKPAGEGFAYSYGPLAHGDFHEFYRRFHADPTAVILDATTLVTLGAGRVAALATLPEGATAAQVAKVLRTGETQGPLKTITARLSEDSAPIPVRTLPRKASRAARIQATDTVLKKLPAGTPGLGEFSRAARAVKREALPTKLTLLHDRRYQAYQREFHKLTIAQRAAVNAIPRWPKVADAQTALKNLHALGNDDSALARELGNPAVWKAYTERPANVMRVVELGRDVSHLREQVLLRTGAITPETVAEAPYRHTRIARGAKFTQPVLPVDVTTPVGSTVRVAGKNAEGKLAEVRGDQALVYYPRFGRSETVATADLEHLAKPTLVGGPSAEELRAEFEQAGLPQPYYLHDVAETAGNRGFGAPSGRTPPRKGADVRQSQGVLVQTGKLLLHPDVTGPAFIRAAKHEWYLQTHDLVKRIAVRIPEGEGLPKGHRWVREVRGEKIPYLETVAGENMAELENALRALPEQQPFTLHPGQPASAAAVVGGFRLAVPDGFARAMDAEFRQSNRVVEFLERYPMALWRALVIKIRIPWLAANIFGNSVLATLKFAGANGLQAVAGMIRTTNGVMALRRMLKLGEEAGAITSADVERLLPELSRGGTFIGTNVPSLGSERLIGLAPTRLEPILRKAHRLGSSLVDFLPHVDRATEGALRRGGATKVLLSAPEVKTLVKKGLTPRAAMTKALESNEDFRRLVVKEVNDGLGDYLSMSHAEQTHVRALIPFYSWLREITRITLRLPVDYPGRSALLAHLATAYGTAGSYPSFLAGFVPTGQPEGDIQPGLNFTAYNPLSSGVDTLAALGTLGVHPTRRGASSLLGSLNPVVPAAVTYLERARTGEAVPNYGLLASALANVGQALPESRVIGNPPSPLYPDRTRLQLLEQFFGDPRRRPSISRAALYHDQGR